MTVYVFNGTNSGTTGVPFVPGVDVLNLTYTNGFDTVTLRTAPNGTDTIVQTTAGANFTLVGVIIEQLSDGDINHQGGDFDIGDNGNNSLTGTIVVGLAGNDDIDGLAGTNDFLQGNQGNDNIDGDGGMDRIRGGQGNDDIDDFDTGSIVYGDLGNDEIDADDDADFTTIFGGNGSTSDPSDGADDIDGSDGNDTIQGNGGDDDIDGDDLNDFIRGGQGNDDLDGDGSGFQPIFPNLDEDILMGDLGNDDIEGDSDADIATGGAGNDIFEYDNNDQGAADDAAISDLTRENISATSLGTTGAFFGLAQLADLDSITDLNLGGAAPNTTVDRVQFTDLGAIFTLRAESGDASNLGEVIDLADLDFGLDSVVLVTATGGTFDGLSFLVADTEGGLFENDPDYVVQVTGLTGDISTDDFFG